MTTEEVTANYAEKSTEQLRALSLEINSILPEFRPVLYAELEKRGETETIEIAKDAVQNYQVPEVKPKTKLKGYDWLKILALVFPIGAALDLIFRVSLFSSDPSPKMTRIIFELVFISLYLLSYFLVRKGKIHFIWISLTLYLFFTTIFVLMMASYGFNLFIGIEFVIRASLIIATLNFYSLSITEFKASKKQVKTSS